MKLVIDTNILFSFFRENPTRSLIVNSEYFDLELFAPEYAIEELKNNKTDLMKYSGLEEKDLGFVLETLKIFIETKSINFFEDFKEKAEKISPDQKDSPFFALALKLNCGIWSNEPRLNKQSVVKIFSTPDMRKLFSI